MHDAIIIGAGHNGLTCAYYLAKKGLKKYFDKMGPWRYAIFVMLLLCMMALPIKMLLRWLFNLKYIVSIGEYFFNI